MHELVERVAPIKPLDDIKFVNTVIPAAILVVKSDAEFTVEKANQSLFDLMGYTPEEFADRFENKGMRAVHPEDLVYALPEFLLQIHSRENQSFSIKARLSHKTEGYRWVHFSGCVGCEEGGQERIYFLLTDITEQQEMLEKLQKEARFHQMVENLCNDAFFDYDILAGSIRFSKNFAERFCMEEVLLHYPSSLLELGIVAEDSQSFFACGPFNECQGTKEEELHMILPSGEEVWYSCHYTSFFDSIGIPVRTVGKLTEITKQKSRMEELADQAARDPLTGLLNKTTTEVLIKTSLKSNHHYGGNHALLIVDVDNFKEINDRLGHFYGDLVLKQLAEGLKAFVTEEDIVGRIGGDEFFIFLHDYEREAKLRETAEGIRGLFRKIFHENMETVSISASIGIALCPEHGEDFYTLYQNADLALYVSKKRGKDSYTIYDGQTSMPYQENRTQIDYRSTGQSKDQSNPLGYIYPRIFHSKDIKRDFGEVLRLLGEHYNFSRSYLFAFGQDITAITNIFEWCAKGVPSAKDRIQQVTNAIKEHMVRSLCHTGFFVLQSREELPLGEVREYLASRGIQSMLQFAIKQKGEIIGVIGFDDVERNRKFREKDVEELGAVCFVLGSMLSRQWELEKLEANNEQMTAVLDELPFTVYVVDGSCYRILYENKAKKESRMLPLKEETLCYEAYWKRDEPCLDCPMKKAKIIDHAAGIRQGECGEAAKRKAKWIPWGKNRSACLITDL